MQHQVASGAAGLTKSETSRCRQAGHRVGYRLAAAGLVFALATAGGVEAQNRRAFVTSTQYNGNFASLAVAGATALDKADTVCRQHAASAGLPNSQTYRAWLSTSTDDVYCRVQGLTGEKATGCNGAPQPGGGPWYQVNGATAFTDTLARLTGPEHAIFRNLLWYESGADCAGWTSAAAMQSTLVGGPSWARREYWTELFGQPCSSSQFRLYCFSSLVASFWDGFESGGTGGWSGATP